MLPDTVDDSQREHRVTVVVRFVHNRQMRWTFVGFPGDRNRYTRPNSLDREPRLQQQGWPHLRAIFRQMTRQNCKRQPVVPEPTAAELHILPSPGHLTVRDPLWVTPSAHRPHGYERLWRQSQAPVPVVSATTSRGYGRRVLLICPRDPWCRHLHLARKSGNDLIAVEKLSHDE